VLARQRRLPTIRLHATRHTLADVLLNAGMPAVDVAAWLGHTTEVLHERYGRSTPAGVREVGTTLGAIYAAAAKRSGSPVRVASTASS
jgi:integrase